MLAPVHSGNWWVLGRLSPRWSRVSARLAGRSGWGDVSALPGCWGPREGNRAPSEPSPLINPTRYVSGPT